MISFEEFKKLDLRVGKILRAEAIEDSDKLLRLEVDLGLETRPASEGGEVRLRRQIVAGIAQRYAPDALIGKEIVIVVNLEPRMLKGVESQGMLLAASCDTEPVLLIPDREVPPGSTVR